MIVAYFSLLLWLFPLVAYLDGIWLRHAQVEDSAYGIVAVTVLSASLVNYVLKFETFVVLTFRAQAVRRGGPDISQSRWLILADVFSMQVLAGYLTEKNFPGWRTLPLPGELVYWVAGTVLSLAWWVASILIWRRTLKEFDTASVAEYRSGGGVQ